MDTDIENGHVDLVREGKVNCDIRVGIYTLSYVKQILG